MEGDENIDDLPIGENHQESQEAPEQPTQSAPLVNADELLKGLIPLFQQSQQKPPTEKPQMTDAERKKALRIWEASPEFLQKFGNIDTQAEALHMLRDGLMNQADVLAQASAYDVEQRIMAILEEKYAPALSHFQQAKVEEQFTRFGTDFPQLAKPELRPLLIAIGKSYQAQGKTFNSEKELFDAIAAGAEASIKSTVPEFVLQRGTPASRASGSRSTGIAKNTPGAGGAGNGGGSGGKSNRTEELFGKLP